MRIVHRDTPAGLEREGHGRDCLIFSLMVAECASDGHKREDASIGVESVTLGKPQNTRLCSVSVLFCMGALGSYNSSDH